MLASRKEKIKSVIRQLMEENNISAKELLDVTDVDEPAQKVKEPERKRPRQPNVKSKQIEPRKKGISDVGVAEQNPTITRSSIVGSGSIVGNRPVIGARGMQEIGDRIFGRRRR